MITNIPDYNGVGLYTLETSDGRVYVGSSKNIHQRIVLHDNTMQKGRASKRLQAIYDSGEAMKASVVLKMPPDTTIIQLRKAETEYLNEVKKHHDVLNGTSVYMCGKGYGKISNKHQLSEPLRPDLM